MAVNFPATPTLNQTYTYNGRSWTWSGAYWRATTNGNFDSISLSGNLTLNGTITVNGSTGVAGQVLKSTGTGLAWGTGSGGGGGGGASNVPLKTFNILGEFGTLIGTARFYPATEDTIKSVLLTIGKTPQQDITVGLYRNGGFLQFFTISAGQTYAKYTGLNYIIQTNESYTVNVVAGSGTNFSMGLFNIDL